MIRIAFPTPALFIRAPLNPQFPKE